MCEEYNVIRMLLKLCRFNYTYKIQWKFTCWNYNPRLLKFYDNFIYKIISAWGGKNTDWTFDKSDIVALFCLVFFFCPLFHKPPLALRNKENVELIFSKGLSTDPFTLFLSTIHRSGQLFDSLFCYTPYTSLEWTTIWSMIKFLPSVRFSKIFPTRMD